MINIYILPFLAFIVGAYIYYSRKAQNLKGKYDLKRHEYLRESSELSKEQRENLNNGIPWKGMDSALLIKLFGEPRRRRFLDQSLTKMIWSYADLFVYLDNDTVIEWKKK